MYGNWFLNSGSTEHMASNREDFYSYTSFDEERKVRIGDRQFMMEKMGFEIHVSSIACTNRWHE